MKRSSVLSAFASLLIFSSLQTATAQPGGYRSGPYRSSPEYNRQNSLPSAPVIIIDADGRRNNQYRNFDNCYVQQALSRKQRKKLEKRYGFVPPLALYVPDRYVNRSGVYVYNNNVVYRKDRNGFFQLDNRYFNDNWDDYSSRDDRYDRNDRRWDNNSFPNRY